MVKVLVCCQLICSTLVVRITLRPVKRIAIKHPTELNVVIFTGQRVAHCILQMFNMRGVSKSSYVLRSLTACVQVINFINHPENQSTHKIAVKCSVPYLWYKHTSPIPMKRFIGITH